MKHSEILQFVNARGAGDAAIRRVAAWAVREGGTPNEFLAMPPHDIASALSVTTEVARSILAERESALRLAHALDAQSIGVVWLGDRQNPSV